MSAMALALKAMGAVPESQRVWGVHEAQGAEILFNFRCFFPQPQITLGNAAHFLAPHLPHSRPPGLPCLRKEGGSQSPVRSWAHPAASFVNFSHFLAQGEITFQPFKSNCRFSVSRATQVPRVSAMPDCWSSIPRILLVCSLAIILTHLPSCITP